MDTIIFTKQLDAFKRVALIGFISLSVVAIAGWLAFFKASTKKEDAIYVVMDNGTVLAKRNYDGLRAPYEIKNHLREFTRLMFQNDQYSFKQNVDLGLSYIDSPGGKLIYEGFVKNDIYNSFIKNNMRTTVEIDSIFINTNVRPVQAKVYLKQAALYSDQGSYITFAYKCNLTEFNRSEKNPYGLLITNFDYILYRPVAKPVEPTAPVIDPNATTPTTNAPPVQ